MLEIEVPFIPPSVNHYTTKTSRGVFKTKEAKQFEKDFDLFIRHDDYVIGKSFTVSIDFVLGAKEKIDTDNILKMIIDGLARNYVFRDTNGNALSDAYVDDIYVHKDRITRPKFSSMTIRVKAN